MAKNLRIFFDVDTQYDFMDKDGALYVPDAELIRPNLRLLTNFAQQNWVLLLGSVDVHFGTGRYKHREGELQRWGGPFPDHCMSPLEEKAWYSSGFWTSVGEHKINETILFEDDRDATYLTICNALDSRYNYINHDSFEARLDIMKSVMEKEWIDFGTYFEKQSYDVFTNPNCEEFLKRLKVNQAVVYGVATDYCVKAAVLGMQRRGIKCYVVEDAIKGVAPDTAKSALDEMVKAGAEMVKTKDVLEGRI